MVRLITAFLSLTLCAFGANEISIGEALAGNRIRVTASGNGRERLQLQITATEKVRVQIPAGSQFKGENGETQMTLRALVVEPAPNSAVDAIIPAAATGITNRGSERAVAFSGPADPKLGKLLELFAAQNDLPRPTAQLAVFLVLHDISWANWMEWMKPAWAAEKVAKDRPTPADVAQAVDGIAFARLAAPDQKFAILAEDGLKRLALRNPWARGKAMALYGLTVEDAITGDSSLPVDLGKLLHTSPNDNCPICRRNSAPVDIP